MHGRLGSSTVSLLNANVLGLHSALADRDFELSDEMRMAAASHQVASLEAAYERARQQLEVAENMSGLADE
jgi:hypothetical protein